MKKNKGENIINKDELLKKIMQQELLELKKKCFKYKHDTPFIRKDITIECGDLSEQKAMGLYKRINGKHEYDFSHKIIVDNRVIDQYLKCKPNYYYGMGRNFYKNRIRKVILHELIHAFVEEYYGYWTELVGVSNDASPIFLSVLFFLKGYSSHECVTAFKKSDLFKKLKDFESFSELDSYLTKMLLDYEKIAHKHKDGIKTVDGLVVNNFVFGSYNAGLNKYFQSKQEFVAKTKADIKLMEFNIFQIGCCTMPEQIDELVNKKRYGKFDKYEYSKVGICNEESVKTIFKTASGM